MMDGNALRGAHPTCAAPFCPSERDMSSFASLNPSTGATVRTYPAHDRAQVEAAVEAATAAWRPWAARPFGERAAVLRAAAEVLRGRTEPYARLMAEEMGKPLAQGRGEVEKCAWVCDWFADQAEGYLADETVDLGGPKAFVACRPLGPVLAIMPWNFPFWQVFRFAAPTLMAGNAGLLKHAPNVFGCAEAIEDVFREAGLPPGLFASLRVDVDVVADLIARPEVAAVTLTGSTRAGRAVGEAAGRALKPSVLELGGSDAYVILEDADLEKAADACVASRLLNSGQSCIAAKRFVVVDPVHDAFVEAFTQRMAAKRFGDPLADASVDLGPMARVDLRDELHRQVEASVAAGARLALGGTVPPGPGAFYPPTVLVDVRPGMPAWDEELFGPVASVIRAKDEADAIRIANGTCFGLGASVWTRDVARGERIARDQLEAGCCVVNDFVRSDPRLPFGGIKESGYGRELAAPGIRAFVNIKSVGVQP